MPDRYIFAVGGGEIKTKTTINIDKHAAKLAKLHAGDKRATAVFVGTASHDSLPYFNSFRKTYTSNFDIKADLALLTKKDIPIEKIKDKIAKANLIYIGGGDTLFMLETWKKTGFLDILSDAYNQGVPIIGLSAGAICWFEKMYTDSEMMNGNNTTYSVHNGLGIIKGMMSPHYDQRPEFDEIAKNHPDICYAIENNSAVLFKNEKPYMCYSAGGNSYVFLNGNKIQLDTNAVGQDMLNNQSEEKNER